MIKNNPSNSKFKRTLNRIFKIAVGILAVLLIISGLMLVWMSAAPKAGPLAQKALVSDSLVYVQSNEDVIFTPKTIEPITGFILYPGARVRPEAYADTAHYIAEKGYLVIVPKMCCNFALMNVNIAKDYIEEYPEIQNWVIGGHSVGGTAAAMFAKKYEEEIAGLIFWASYPSNDTDLSNFRGMVTSIWADRDGLTTQEKINDTKYLLPKTTEYDCIIGGDHRQFADYPVQIGDHPATISMEKQHSELENYTLQALKMIHYKP